MPVLGGSKPPFGVPEGPPELEKDEVPAHGDILSSIQSIAKSLVTSEPFGELPRRTLGSRLDLWGFHRWRRWRRLNYPEGGQNVSEFHTSRFIALKETYKETEEEEEEENENSNAEIYPLEIYLWRLFLYIVKFIYGFSSLIEEMAEAYGY